MFERPQSGEAALLVHVNQQGIPDPDELSEFSELARSAGAEIIRLETVSRRTPDPGLFIGRGKAEQLRGLVESEEIDLVIFDNALSPSQERNLEALFQCRVLDRTGLILDIFAQRARSFEGKLQVELAQLRHLSTRLVRGWTHLERQKGGIGLRGPGETQLETDRRLLNNRIDQIRRRLARVDSQREQGRRARHRAEVPTVSLVGYTNAGKSTLFNRLTSARVYAKDQLFATLDPTLRRAELPDGSHLILADTVGFISKLPHELVAAFKSTLQETVEADMLLHVVDAASHRRSENIAEVEDVLGQIGANELPRIELYNKIDMLDGSGPKLERDETGKVTRVWLSASTGEGCDMLLEALADYFHIEVFRREIILSPAEGRLHALFYAEGRVVNEEITEEGGWRLQVVLTRREYQHLRKQEPRLAELLEDLPNNDD